jgi:acetate kinase
VGFVKILVVNAGSSTYKCELFDIQSETPLSLWKGALDWGKGLQHCQVTFNKVEKACAFDNSKKAFQSILDACPENFGIVAHRIVHGGKEFTKPTWISSEVFEKLKILSSLAPLHNPISLQAIEIIQSCLGSIKQIAFFDTSFHAHMPDVAKIYALPYAWSQEGIQRYGFHGISHQYCSKRAATLLKQELKDLKMICCHLGRGCSLAAISQGISIDTTMGFTPLEGLMMGSRSGSIDPGLILYLLKEKKISVDALDHILNEESGLKGISGTRGDMRMILEKMQKGDAQAKLAYEMFVYRLRGWIGYLITALRGLDVLIFTGGIGENVPGVRTTSCEDLGFPGVILDEESNQMRTGDRLISSKDSKVNVFLIHTQEALEIAMGVKNIYIQ